MSRAPVRVATSRAQAIPARPPLRIVREPTDDELLLAGDADSFEAFYRRHCSWVLGFLARRTHDPELAADLCAEVFAAALVARRRYRPRDGAANAWLYRIALNKLNDALRRGYAEDRARRRLGMRPVAPDTDDLRAIEAYGGDLTSLVDDLPPEQAAAVRARVIDERGYDAIAAQLGVPEATVRKRVSRGLSGLRARIGGRP